MPYFTETKMSSDKQFTLFPYQQEHVQCIGEILSGSQFAFDFSMLGTGKTYTASQIAIDLGVCHVIVVAPVSVLPKWKTMQSMQIPIRELVSFCSLRSVIGKQPKHGLLERIDMKRKYGSREVDAVEFKASDRLKKMISEGALIIIDEIQNIKNNSAQFHAVCEMLRPILSMDSSITTSRVLLLSGSPIDKEEQAARMFKTVGVMRAEELCKWHTSGRGVGYYDYTGYREIRVFCQSNNPDAYNVLEKKFKHLQLPWDVQHALKMSFELFQTCFKPLFSHAMKPIQMPVKLTKVNGYFTMNQTDAVRLSDAIMSLAKATRYDLQKQQVVYGTNSADTMRCITIALMDIESAKIPLLERLVHDSLDTHERRKVIVCVNYRQSIDTLKSSLCDYNPLILDGTLSVKQRASVIEKFQMPSTKHRLLIGNFAVCSTGIDLDDKHGDYPRVMYANPQYNTITTYQLCHRVQRMDTRSDAEIYMVYGKTDNDTIMETSILNALARKGQVMRETVKEQATAGVLFPCDFPTYIE